LDYKTFYFEDTIFKAKLHGEEKNPFLVWPLIITNNNIIFKLTQNSYFIVIYFQKKKESCQNIIFLNFFGTNVKFHAKKIDSLDFFNH
jgi:hypothetical protein